MHDSDTLHRFHFAQVPVRGVAVKLGRSFLEALNGRDYSPAVCELLGQSLASTALMSANLKFPATLTLQARGNGSISLLMAECLSSNSPSSNDNNPPQTIRGVARTVKQSQGDTGKHGGLLALLGDAHLAITIEPDQGQRYQGIVGLANDSLDACLQDYFYQSEQLPTHLQLYADASSACGLLLQQMPGDPIDTNNSEIWQELLVLAETLSATELRDLPVEQVLHRLFHQNSLHLSRPSAIRFQCSCSQQRSANALSQLDPVELEAIFEEDGEIIMDCEFCSTRYRFSRQDLDKYLASQQSTRH